MPRSGWRRWRAWARTSMPSRCDLNRKGRVTRKSRETQLSARIDLEGRGRAEVSTGLAFVDHMLEQVARYGGFDLKLRGAGDVQGDPHHLVEDAGIVLGQALSQALGERDGIARFASAYAPLDESLARGVIDLGPRPFLSCKVLVRGRGGGRGGPPPGRSRRARVRCGHRLTRGRSIRACARQAFGARVGPADRRADTARQAGARRMPRVSASIRRVDRARPA